MSFNYPSLQPRYRELVSPWMPSRLFQWQISGADPEFGQGGPQLLRLKVADIAKQSRASEASNLRPGPLKGPGSF